MSRLVIYPPVNASRLEQVRAAAPDLEVINADTPATAQAAMPEAEAFFGKLTPELLAAAPRLRWVQSPTASLEHYLFPALIEHPCQLSNMRGIFSDVIADHVLGLVLCFARNLHRYIRNQAEGRWEPVAAGGPPVVEQPFSAGPSHVTATDAAHIHLPDATLGIVGVGGIGAEIARRASDFGMTIIGIDPHVRSIAGACEDVWPTHRLPDLLAMSDFVVIAAPHTPETEKLFRRREFAAMKRSSFLVNVGRGVIVDLADLDAALEAGDIAGAALDVCEVEPLPPDHPLWRRDNVIITPHVAAASPRIAERHLAILLENVRRFAAGDPPLNPVSKQDWF